MSGICAVVRRDGGPSDVDLIDRLLAAAPHRGLLCHRRSSPGSSLGCQSTSWRSIRSAIASLGHLTIAFHGRLDNRSELRTLLDQKGPFSSAEDDARLVLRAFEHWREGCADRLLGDFAFVIHDSARRLMYAARDPIGVKPLFYFLSEQALIAATDIVQVIAAGVPLEPCEGMAAELLAFDLRSRTETLYRDIHRLAPGHWMLVTERSVRLTRYWTPDPLREICYLRDEDYAEHFFQLLRAAVGNRAPDDTAVAAYLSGGLDSSSVVCTARTLERSFETFSLVFPDVPEADERPYIDAVSSVVGAPSHLLEAAPIDPGEYRRLMISRADLPELPSDALGEPLLAAMRSRELDIALTGVGGDFGFAGSLQHYGDLLLQRDFSGLLRQWWSDRNTSDVGWSAGRIFSEGFRLVVPPPIRRAVKPLAKRAGWGISIPPWLGRQFAARTDLLQRLEADRGGLESALPTRRYVCELFDSGWTSRLLETLDRAAADYGVELRHPFYDRRLVEFAIAIPERQRWRGRTTKFVVREAMRQSLPESVYARMGKADASPFVPHAIEALGGEAALGRLHIAELGWVSSDALASIYRRARHQFERRDDAYCDGMFSVWMALAVDAWYRAIFVEDRLNELRQQRRPEAGGRRRQDRYAPEEAVPIA